MRSRLASQLPASISAQHLQADVLLCISCSYQHGERMPGEEEKQNCRHSKGILHWHRERSQLLAKLKNEVGTPGAGHWEEISSPVDH